MPLIQSLTFNIPKRRQTSLWLVYPKLSNAGQNKQGSEKIYIFIVWTVPLSVILAAVVTNVFAEIDCVIKGPGIDTKRTPIFSNFIEWNIDKFLYPYY